MSIKIAFSKTELQAHALKYMIDTHGRPKDIENIDDKNDWYEKLGVLVEFIDGIMNVPTEARDISS